MIDLDRILEAELTDARGATVSVRERVAGRPAVLVFVRHFG